MEFDLYELISRSFLFMEFDVAVIFTGDVAFRILETINNVDRRAIQDTFEDDLQAETQIYVCDINPNMLDVGRKRAQQRGEFC
jgi:ubiquinone/menaquinone biosynthesis C-methylase UbiE